LATAAFLIMMIFPRTLLSIFTTDSELLDIGVRAIRLVILVLPLLGLQIIGSTYFQAVGKALPSLVLGMSRQIILLLPLTLLLPLVLGVAGVWAAFPVADFLATVLTVIWLIIELKKLRPVHPTGSITGQTNEQV
jgi:Na+-driven multidrug efflux pump